MVKSILATFILLLSLCSQGNYSYFFFDKKKVSVSEASFNRYIRSQARSIVIEFYHTLRKLDPYHKVLLGLRQDIRSQQQLWKEIRVSCQTSDKEKECEEKFHRFFKRARALDIEILKAIESAPSLEKIKSAPKRDSIIKTISYLKAISNENYKMIHYLEESLITKKTIYENYFHADIHFDRAFHRMLIKLNFTYGALLDKEYKAQFESCWSNFIKPLEERVVDDRSFTYLLDNLEQLNIAWNNFHMKVDKGIIGVPKHQATTLKIMHNRWNSILKMILRNH